MALEPDTLNHEAEGSSWTQMRDPEGNESCVLRGTEDGWSPDER